jgi:hypothetical protein
MNSFDSIFFLNSSTVMALYGDPWQVVYVGHMVNRFGKSLMRSLANRSLPTLGGPAMISGLWRRGVFLNGWKKYLANRYMSP